MTLPTLILFLQIRLVIKIKGSICVKNKNRMKHNVMRFFFLCEFPFDDDIITIDDDSIDQSLDGESDLIERSSVKDITKR